MVKYNLLSTVTKQYKVRTANLFTIKHVSIGFFHDLQQVILQHTEESVFFFFFFF